MRCSDYDKSWLCVTCGDLLAPMSTETTISEVVADETQAADEEGGKTERKPKKRLRRRVEYRCKNPDCIAKAVSVSQPCLHGPARWLKQAGFAGWPRGVRCAAVRVQIPCQRARRDEHSGQLRAEGALGKPEWHSIRNRVLHAPPPRSFSAAQCARRGACARSSSRRHWGRPCIASAGCECPPAGPRAPRGRRK